MKKAPNIKKAPRESLRDPTRRVKCALFQSKNEGIERITQRINEVQDIREKASLAKYLLKEVEDLLSCNNFNEKRPGCKICHYVADLRKKTANLIIEAEKLK